MNGKWIEVFKAGIHTASDGTVATFTVADLDRICASYNTSKHEAPLVVGHPKENHPAFGWVERIRRSGDKLEILPKQVNPDFTELVRSGAFKKRSISLYPDKSLRHVGFLGANPPSVKGLKEIEFNADASFVTFEIDEPTSQEVGQAQKDVIADLQNLVEKHAKKLEEHTVQLAELEACIAKSNEDNSAKDAETFCNDLITQGKITPAQKDEVIKLLTDNNLSFSEKSSAKDALKRFLSSMPRAVNFGEFATDGVTGGVTLHDFKGVNVDTKRAVVYAKAKNYQEKDSSLSFEQAVERAITEVENA